MNIPLVRDFMTFLNIWSFGHFIQWTIIGRYFLENRYLFWILSIGWEIIELGLPFEFAIVLLFCVVVFYHLPFNQNVA